MNGIWRWCLLLLGLWAGMATAQEEPELLEPDRAFELSVRQVEPAALEVHYRIADGYYMYRDKFAFEAMPASVQLGQPVFPPGQVHDDEFFGRTETYRGELSIRIPVSGSAERAQLRVTSQGCADIGVCYPPHRQVRTFQLAAADGGGNVGGTSAVEPAAAAGSVNELLRSGRTVRNEAPMFSDEARFTDALESGRLPLIVSLFFVAGILLTFTPCVLPMIPILSGLIVGEGRQVTRTNATVLSIAYVLGMVVTYTAIGVGAALSGAFFAAALQNPWVLGAFALIFVALALSMFDFYDIPIPFQSHAIAASGKLPGGRIGAVAVRGMLSAAIVSPCVAAPLAGALLYISQTRDALLGGSALFAMALGMGVPLIAVGVTGGALLPKSGHWMKAVKKFFGFLLLGVAVWIVSPLLPVAAQMTAWATLLIVGAMFLHALDPLPAQAAGVARFWKGIGVIALLVGASLLVGALSGGQSLLRPLDAVGGRVAKAAEPNVVRFERVRDVAELEARLAAATQPVLLDFYADWCVSCKEMEAFTFTDPQVRERMGQMHLLQVDVTRNSAADQALLKRFRLFGPPAIIFFTAEGQETGARVIGYQPARRFQQTLDGVLNG